MLVSLGWFSRQENCTEVIWSLFLLTLKNPLNIHLIFSTLPNIIYVLHYSVVLSARTAPLGQCFQFSEL